LWLADLDRCWTAERLAPRGLPRHAVSPLYDQAIKSIQHLLVECSFTRQIWHETIAWLRLPCSAPTTTTTSLLDWWQEAKQNVPRQMLKGLTSLRFLVEEKTFTSHFKHKQFLHKNYSLTTKRIIKLKVIGKNIC
jgi:hypothetical protein